jgi:hypothetical protein
MFKVKLKNNRDSLMVPKDGIVNVISESKDTYLGEYFDVTRNRTEKVRVRKENCTLIK